MRIIEKKGLAFYPANNAAAHLLKVIGQACEWTKTHNQMNEPYGVRKLIADKKYIFYCTCKQVKM